MWTILLVGCLVDRALYERRLEELTDHDGDGYVQEADCDDADADAWPGAAEVCNGVDDDCDGVVDEDAEDASPWYPDADGDRFGEEGEPVRACDSPGSGWSAEPGDCDDGDDSVHPGATEVPYDGVDQDCVEGDLVDQDGDGASWPEDCDDLDPGVQPGAPEVWADGFTDNDCDASLEVDEPLAFGEATWFSRVEWAELGGRVAAWKDVDGDGRSEFLASATGTSRDHAGSGAVYVLGGEGPRDVDADALAVIAAGGPSWYLSTGLDASEDVDGDDVRDILVTAPGRDTEGAAFLVSGAAVQAGDVTLPAHTVAVFEGGEAGEYWGSDAVFLGDVDGDGRRDVAVSAAFASGGGWSSTGRIAVFGLASASYDLASPDIEWVGYYDGARFGERLQPVGDVDDDGYADTAVSAAAGDIVQVLPGRSGSIDDVAISTITRDDPDAAWRPAVVGDVDGDQRPDIAVLGDARALLFTGLGGFTVRTELDAWASVVATDGTSFSDAADLGDVTGDGRSETLVSATWSAADETAWLGVLFSESLDWRTEVDLAEIEVRALSTRPDAAFGHRIAAGAGAIAVAGPNDDRGAEGGGSVAVLPLPE